MHDSTRRDGYPMVSSRCRRWLRWKLTPEDPGGSHRLRHRAGVGGGLLPHPAVDSSLARRGVRAVQVTTLLGLYRSYGPPWPRRRWPDSPIPIRLLGASSKFRQVPDSELAEPRTAAGDTAQGRAGTLATSQRDANATAQSGAPPQDSRRRRTG